MRKSINDIGWVIYLSAVAQEALSAADSRQQMGPLSQDIVEKDLQDSNFHVLENFIQPVAASSLDL